MYAVCCPMALSVYNIWVRGQWIRRELSQFCMHTCKYIYYVSIYVYLSELLLGDSPRSGMCAPERAVAWSLSTFRLYMYVYLSLCVPERAVARRLSTFRYVCT